MRGNRILSCMTAVGCLVLAGVATLHAELPIVNEGKPNAEIVITEQAPRTTRLAARELQKYIARISGVTLSITNRPAAPVQVYVGRSPLTDKLGVKPYDIKDGGYRIASGDTWIALIGRDDDFTPTEPWPKNNADWKNGSVMERWDALTGNAKWGNPLGGIYKNKNYFDLAPSFGEIEGETRNREGKVLVWSFDERGSFNAVCDILRRLGVRWYMPGEIGEIVPRQTTITLPLINETVRSVFPLRQFSIRFSTQGPETALWAMHLGLRDGYGIMIAHGIATMTSRPEFREMHPNDFALYGGKRDSRPDVDHKRQLCLSSPQLFDENVRYARAVFDHYDFDMVSVWPPDGYCAICQCPLCKGKDSPDRDYSGRLSDYVWDYVNRVAGEVAKTHPDKKILCGAYGIYTLPPQKIEKLNPNVVVCIVGGRRPIASRPEQQKEISQLRAAWLEKTATPLMIFENYPLTTRGFYLPAYCAKTVGESINAIKGVSMGEDIWFTPGRDLHAPGYNHFNLYFTARMYWEDNVNDLFGEYCRLFYGPAEQEMKAFFEYCESNWQEMKDDLGKVTRALALFDAAKQKVDSSSLYGRRMDLVADFLQGLRDKSTELAEPRGPSPECVAWDGARQIKVDGQLDDAFWQKVPDRATGRLVNLQTGAEPLEASDFKVAWGDGNIWFAVRCEDTDAANLNIGTSSNEDPAIWFGDVIEIILETDLHAYYQIAIAPSGAIVDLDRSMGKGGFQWNSQAEVAAARDEHGWTLEARIPVIQDENDPLHQVIGNKPTPDAPWYFNVCRQRLRDKESELTAFAPTGRKGFHFPRKFGKLYVK